MPNRQYPTGTTLSPDRTSRLLRWTRATGALEMRLRHRRRRDFLIEALAAANPRLRKPKRFPPPLPTPQMAGRENEADRWLVRNPCK
jgi:hypothetical protein